MLITNSSSGTAVTVVDVVLFVLSVTWCVFLTSFSVSFFVARALVPEGMEGFFTALWNEITGWVQSIPLGKEPLAYYPDIPASRLELELEILETFAVPELTTEDSSPEAVNGGRADLRECEEVERMLEPCWVSLMFVGGDDAPQPARPCVDLRCGPWRALPSPGHLAPPAQAPSGGVIPDAYLQVIPAIVFPPADEQHALPVVAPAPKQAGGFLAVPARGYDSKMALDAEMVYYSLPEYWERDPRYLLAVAHANTDDDQDQAEAEDTEETDTDETEAEDAAHAVFVTQEVRVISVTQEAPEARAAKRVDLRPRRNSCPF